MCSLVTIMCALLAPWAATGRLLPQTSSPGPCVSQCLRTVQQLAQSDPRLCCDHAHLCDKMCLMTLEAAKDSVPPGVETSPLLPASAWDVLVSACAPCLPHRSLRSPALREAAIIARSVGLDLGAPDDRIPVLDTPSAKMSEAPAPFNLRLEAVSTRQGMTTAQVAWNPSPGPRPWYLVSWQPEGGGLTGNLLTNSSATSLSLEPGLLYHVQVSGADREDSSECLEVDLTSPSRSTLSAVEGVAAAILVFLMASLLLASLRPSKAQSLAKEVDQHQHFDHFKMYPPPVTLMPAQPQAQRSTAASYQI